MVGVPIQSLTDKNIGEGCHDINSILFVTVKNGNGLQARSISLDPYLQLEHDGNISISHVQYQTGPNCDFNWTVAFPFRQLHPGSVWPEVSETNLRHNGKSLDLAGDLVIEVKDENSGWNDTSVGKGVIKYQDILHALENQLESLKLIHKSSLGLTTKSGSLNVEYRLEKWSPSNFPLPTLNLLENHNTRGGMIRSMIDGCSFGTFPTWQIHLWEVGKIFNGNYCGWNESYAAAQKIYGPSVESMAIRQAIRSQHSMLYSKDKGFGTYERHMICGIKDFIRVLPNGDKNTQRDKSVRFTYVISTSSCMNFSITSKKIAQDFLSKHALHNNAGTEVVFAGEFFIDWKSERYTSTGKPALIIDNNSGTFAPSKEKLGLLQRLLEFNFGAHLPIITLDRGDAALNEYFEANNID
jgi:hypothetical protein